jgi:hypothetical protein
MRRAAKQRQTDCISQDFWLNNRLSNKKNLAALVRVAADLEQRLFYESLGRLIAGWLEKIARKKRGHKSDPRRDRIKSRGSSGSRACGRSAKPRS